MFKQAYEKLYGMRRRYATAGVVLAALYIGYFVLFGANGILAHHSKRVEYGKLEKEIQQLQQENKRLAENVTDLKTSPKAIEKEAREQLKYVRPGEVVYTMPQPKPAQQNQQTAKK